MPLLESADSGSISTRPAQDRAEPTLSGALSALQLLTAPTRCAILRRLQAGAATVTEVVQAVDKPQPVVSTHLSLLKTARITAGTREGKFIRYALTGRGRVLVDCLDRLMACDEAAGG